MRRPRIQVIERNALKPAVKPPAPLAEVPAEDPECAQCAQQVEAQIIEDGGITPSYRLTNGFAWRTNLKGFKQSFRGDFAYATGGVLGMVRT